MAGWRRATYVAGLAFRPRLLCDTSFDRHHAHHLIESMPAKLTRDTLQISNKNSILTVQKINL